MQKVFGIKLSYWGIIIKKLSQIKGDQLGIRFYFVDDCFGHALQFGRYLKEFFRAKAMNLDYYYINVDYRFY